MTTPIQFKLQLPGIGAGTIGSGSLGSNAIGSNAIGAGTIGSGTSNAKVESPDGGVDRFANLMLESIDHVNSMQQEADRAVELLATGGDVQTAEVLTSMQKADMSFRLMLQIRNKLMQAYQEINQIRI